MYSSSARARIAQNFILHPEVVTWDEIRRGHPAAQAAHAFFGTWGFPRLSATDLSALPQLEIVFFAAGSIKAFGEPFLATGIKICTAKLANARVVADTCVAQITLAAKNFFGHARAYRDESYPALAENPRQASASLNGTHLALIGGGMIAREIIKRLAGSQFKITVVDPYLSEVEAVRLGVSRNSLTHAFQSCEVVSNHLPNLPELTSVITEEHLRSMPPHATFINTGRGAQVDEPGLIRALQEREDLTALLDVTSPEPPSHTSPLYRMPNVLLTPHIAGCQGGELEFLVNEVITSSERWLAGEPLENLETLENLKVSA